MKITKMLVIMACVLNFLLLIYLGWFFVENNWVNQNIEETSVKTVDGNITYLSDNVDTQILDELLDSVGIIKDEYPDQFDYLLNNNYNYKSENISDVFGLIVSKLNYDGLSNLEDNSLCGEYDICTSYLKKDIDNALKYYSSENSLVYLDKTCDSDKCYVGTYSPDTGLIIEHNVIHSIESKYGNTSNDYIIIKDDIIINSKETPTLRETSQRKTIFMIFIKGQNGKYQLSSFTTVEV